MSQKRDYDDVGKSLGKWTTRLAELCVAAIVGGIVAYVVIDPERYSKDIYDLKIDARAATQSIIELRQRIEAIERKDDSFSEEIEKTKGEMYGAFGVISRLDSLESYNRLH